MNVKIKYHDEKMPKLEKIAKGNWIDVRAVEGGTLTRNGVKMDAPWEMEEIVELGEVVGHKKVLRYKVGDFLMINLGISIAPPDGWEVYLAPRSSTYKNYGLIQTNSWGIGDDSFRGNKDIYHQPFFATRDGVIELYDRIGQFRIQETMPELTLEEVDDTGYDDRGGFGSTGKR